MAFFEQRFDERLSFGARGGPMWSTTKAMTIAGRRSVNRNWVAPLHRYNVAHAIKGNDDFEIVRSFFYVVQGAYDGFRFKDWSDFEATQDNSRLTLISDADYQLQRRYTVGAREFLRDILKPAGAVTVYRTRGGVVSVATADVDTTTGIATISGHADGDTYTWTGEFDVPVAFESDVMEAEIVDVDDGEYLVQWPSIILEEIRL